MTRTRFQSGLDELKERLTEMSITAERAIDLGVEAYLGRDAGTANEVLKLERETNSAEREIDQLAIDLLAMQQPMAVDLRFITACMKINADLERVGDLAVNIAERALAETNLPKMQLPVDLGRMATTAAGMIRRALDSFVDANSELAEAVLIMDDAVDRMNKEIFVSMASLMRSNPQAVDQALDAVVVARALERVADHATNIAEDVIFWVKGKDVRHGAAREAV
ncbi:MAG: phosphate signaling complex protein PhoU [Terriglobales bacterium]